MATSYRRYSTYRPQEPKLTDWEVGRTFRVCLHLVVCLLFPPSVCLRGFCYFNSVAIAAKQLQHKLSVSKVLIVDWVGSLCWLCPPAGVLFCFPYCKCIHMYSILLPLSQPAVRTSTMATAPRKCSTATQASSTSRCIATTMATSSPAAGRLLRWVELPLVFIAQWEITRFLSLLFCDSPLLICDCVFAFRLALEQERASMSTLHGQEDWIRPWGTLSTSLHSGTAVTITFSLQLLNCFLSSDALHKSPQL